MVHGHVVQRRKSAANGPSSAEYGASRQSVSESMSEWVRKCHTGSISSMMQYTYYMQHVPWTQLVAFAANFTDLTGRWGCSGARKGFNDTWLLLVSCTPVDLTHVTPALSHECVSFYVVYVSKKTIIITSGVKFLLPKYIREEQFTPKLKFTQWLASSIPMWSWVFLVHKTFLELHSFSWIN